MMEKIRKEDICGHILVRILHLVLQRRSHQDFNVHHCFLELLLQAGNVPFKAVLQVGNVPFIAVLQVGDVPFLAVLQVGDVPFIAGLSLLDLFSHLLDDVAHVFSRDIDPVHHQRVKNISFAVVEGFLDGTVVG
jgi:hypothetical protein